MENNIFVSFSPIEQQQPVFDMDEIEYNNINLPYSNSSLGIQSGQTSFAPKNPYDQLLSNMSTQQTQTTSTQQSNAPVSGSALDRGVYVAKKLVERGGFTKEQAAAIAGTMIDENKCDPGSYMKAEKAGRGAKGTGGNGYGAGIGSWTGALKQRVLSQAGYSPNTRIEDLSMDQQIDMLIKDTQTGNKKYYDALRRCKTIEDASATSVLITGGVGKSKNWDTHPTQEDAKRLSDWYGVSNDRRFGKSPYHWNLDVRRLNYSKQILAKL